MTSANYKMIEYFCDHFNDNQIFTLAEYVTPDFEFSSPMKEKLNFLQYSHYVSYLSNSIRFEVLSISTDDDKVFDVTVLLDIVDAQQSFEGKITAQAEIRLKHDMVERLSINYSGSQAELDYMQMCTKGFKQNLLQQN